MGRKTHGKNWRAREAVGVRRARERKASEVVELMERGDPDDFERIIALLQAEEADEAAN